MLKIAKALAENSDAIFADEPTCNLDNGSIEYITNTLKYYSGSVVVISHDRYFLDEIVNKIWEIENGKITEYWGNYTQYLEQKEQENRTHIRKYEQYVNEKQRLEKIVDEKLKQAQKVGKRKSLNISQQQLSDDCKISQTTYSGYETGNYLINTTNLYYICKTYNISMDWIVGRTNNKKIGK